MKPARTLTDIESPHTWSQVVNGEWAAELLQAQLDEWWPKLFGYHMLKLGGLSCELASGHCNIQHQICIDKFNPLHTVIADHFSLPFVEKSFDACVITHQLDYCSDPHRLLREIDRVMVDDGYILLSGYNPVSILGMRGLLPWNRKRFPWKGRMFMPMRVKDWLGVLNYEVVFHENFAVLPATKHQACSAWAESVLSETCSSVGSMYLIVARKRTVPLKPIKPTWKLRRQLTPLGLNCRTKVSQKIKGA
ncbi:methyltransferase domain-containing protein [Photobacterium alginatilyticum]|uniref:Class I SAM-dependent methyltransferase n=1 Tax=Photobacterium alginatilyticum TaxID=1775171 RepID=A0ABW9YRN7_9GAMM|nr:methyltransferase domain-containing protein [Photobacterium alginatilyticum]NBI55671.1 class I SAM-dependent methyltransferase [Photobacterium alginatilyticum]